MSAPALDPVRTPSSDEAVTSSGRTGKQARTTPARFDTALGWNDRPGVSWALRILLCATALGIFAVPFLTIVSGALTTHPSGSSLTFLPTTARCSTSGWPGSAASGTTSPTHSS